MRHRRHVLEDPCRLRTTSRGTGRVSSAPRPRRGLGLIELLTIVAVLAIALAFMVSMARHVRSTSANELTRKRMQAIARALHEADERGIDATTSFPHALTRGNGRRSDRETVLAAFAQTSSRQLASRVAGEGAGASAAGSGEAERSVPELNDAWGRPIALMPGQLPEVGMAPDDGPFLVSAGPDGRFLTLADNLYSYDLPALLPARRQPATAPVLP